VKSVSVIFLFCAVVSVMVARQAYADDSSVILSIIMTPQNTTGLKDDSQVDMTLSDLQTLPVASFETTTLWTPDKQVFSGVWLATLLQHHGITSGTLELAAINDYRVTIPVQDIRTGGALVSYERNGEAMSLRQKGPLWVVYDWDSNPNFRNETYYSRSIWQLDRIIVTR